jgi:hypothetical protein
LRESCVFSYAEGPGARYLVLVGDSHAGSLSEDLRRLARANRYNFIQLPRPDAARPGYGDPICMARAAELGSYLAPLGHPLVVYSARIPPSWS